MDRTVDDMGEMQMLLRPVPDLASPPDLGDDDISPRGRAAASEKKKDVLTDGVRGVRGKPALGVFSMDPKPPGEKRPFELGEWSHARTLEESKAAAAAAAAFGLP